ncbi:hypothetical protein, partial [Streptomyces collinus]|uniref:hypothetical protein n=1 Tax=Streptomyces collinus TaxID=42684 RepID=UPI003690FD01
MADKDDPCEYIIGEAHKYCMRDHGGPPADSGPGGGGITGNAADNVKNLANSLIKTLKGLVAPKDTWAPAKADSWVYEQFLWLGQHLAVAIFFCVVVVGGGGRGGGGPPARGPGGGAGGAGGAVGGVCGRASP